MNVQYLTDINGHKNAVLLALTDWDRIQKDLEELEQLRMHPKQKLSERIRGTISKERAMELNEQLEQMRNEWERPI